MQGHAHKEQGRSKGYSSEELYRVLFEQAGEGIFIANEMGQYIEVNPRGCEMLGYSREEILQFSMSDLVPAKDILHDPLHVEELRAGKVVTNERHLRHKDGSLIPVEISGKMLSDGKLLGLVRDIGDRKRLEEEEIFQLSRFPAEDPNPVMRLSNQGQILYANAASRELLEEIGAEVNGVLPSEWKEKIRKLASSGTGKSLDVACKERVYSLVASSMPGTENINLYGSDVTERKRSEKALREAEEKYHNIFTFSLDGIFQSTPSGRIIAANPALASMWGYDSPEDLINSVTNIAVQIYVKPEQRNDFLHAMETDERVHGFEFQVYRKDGSIIWVQESVRAVRDKDGAIQYYEGTIRDITNQKQAEEFLRRSEERYRRTLNNMLEGCQIIDYDWRYIYINDIGAEHGRRKPEEILMHTMPELYPGIEETELFKVLKTCMEERKPSRIENQFTFPDGDKGWFELSIEPVPEGLFILSVNITDRKRAEKKVKEQLNRLIALSEIDQVITSSLDLNFTLNQLIGHLVQQLEVDAATILLADATTNTLKYIADKGVLGIALKNRKLRYGEGFPGRVALERQMIYVPNMAIAEHPFAQITLTENESFVGYYGLPLVAKGQLKGVLEVFQRRPFEPDEEWLFYLSTFAKQAAIAIDNAQLFSNLQQTNAELSLAYDATIEGWSYALDLRDKETEGHTRRVADMTTKLCKKFGWSEKDITNARWGALLHDIGKMGIPDAILQKPDKLSQDEWEIMQKHPVFARNMLERISYLKSAIDIPYCHHEKWDGTGYPRGLSGEQIPFAARIFAIVDAWDALTSDRPYRQAWSKAETLEYIKSMSGKHFDPQVVQVFLESENLWNS